jgi:adenine phosphoribosyltransferase
MYYRMNVAGLDRDLPVCPVTDDLYIAGFVIFGDPELTTACAKELLANAPEFDYMITAEAKGIPLIHEMARQSGAKKYFLARKAPKLYMTGIMEVKVKSITTAKEQTLYLDTADAELMKGKKILPLLLFTKRKAILRRLSFYNILFFCYSASFFLVSVTESSFGFFQALNFSSTAL